MSDEVLAETFLTAELEGAMAEASQQTGKLRRQLAQIDKCIKAWDLKQLRQRLPEVKAALAEAGESASRLDTSLGAFEPSVQGSGLDDYTARLAEATRQAKVTLTGEFPEFEAFPLRIHLDLGQEQVIIGRKRTTALEPRQLARSIAEAQNRLHSSSFNARRFMQALLTYYDLLAQADRTTGRQARLIDIYSLMSARTGGGGYSRLEFAFDIYRLRRESDMVQDGRRLSFGNTRQGNFSVPNGRGGVDLLGSLEVVEVTPDE